MEEQQADTLGAQGESFGNASTIQTSTMAEIMGTAIENMTIITFFLIKGITNKSKSCPFQIKV